MIDDQVPERLRAWTLSQLEMCGAVLLISVVSPVFILAASPLLIFLIRVQVRQIYLGQCLLGEMKVPIPWHLFKSMTELVI